MNATVDSAIEQLISSERMVRKLLVFTLLDAKSIGRLLLCRIKLLTQYLAYMTFLASFSGLCLLVQLLVLVSTVNRVIVKIEIVLHRVKTDSFTLL